MHHYRYSEHNQDHILQKSGQTGDLHRHGTDAPLKGAGPAHGKIPGQGAAHRQYQ